MEAWVTAVGDEDEVVKACRLAFSLKRFHTGKCVVVLVARNVSSQESLESLRSAFDHVLPLAFYDFEGGLMADWRDDVKEEVEAAAKIRLVSMTVFRKCVYLNLNFEAVNNCDDIFDKYGPLALVSDDNMVRSIDPGIMVVVPSPVLYSEMAAHIRSNHGETIATVFQSWAVAKVENKAADVIKRDAIARIRRGEKEMVANSGWRLFQSRDDQTDAADELQESRALLEKKAAGESEPIAIVGLSLRLPGANTPDDFWDLILNGREAIKSVPEHRWKPEATGTQNADRDIEAGFLDCEVDEVDARFFGWNAAELEYLDPQQILLHEVVWEALEDGGVIPSKLESTRTGIFVGEWIRNAETIAGKMPGANLVRKYLGTSLATAAGRLAHFLGTTGPALGIETACSSSLIALHFACTSLARKECEMAIAGGANLILEPFPRSTAVTEGILAKDGRCKTFDASADGFGRAEGVAALVLKRLSDAVRNGDRIWGVVRGSAVVQEGTSRNLGTPTVESESLVMELALKSAGTHPKDVTVVEVHGTGTPVGDPVEVAAIKKVYSEGRTEPLLLGSVKTNIGHTEAVAGIASIIKVLLAMREEMLPPHRNLIRLNPAIELDSIPARIPLSPEPWNRIQNRPRVAGVSAFGIGGAGGHVILEEPPRSREPIRKLQQAVNERPLHVLKLSAKSSAAFEQLLERYASHLDDMGSDLADIAFSANTGRDTFLHRAVVIAKDSVEAAQAIRSRSFEQRNSTAIPTSPICFLFTGYGTHYHGTAMKLYGSCPAFQVPLDRCAKLLEKKYGIYLHQLEENSTLAPAGCGAIAGFCVQYALFRMWRAWGVRPDFVLGHSMGEFCAAVAVSALSLEDALHLIVGFVMLPNIPDGKMIILNEGREGVEKLLKEFESNNNLAHFALDVAATNCVEQSVVAGHPEQIDAFAEYSKGMGVAVQVFSGGGTALHSRLMETLLKPYREVLSTLKLPPQRNLEKGPKYVSAMEGRLVELEHLDVDYWVRHLREEVRFDEACRAVKREGCNLFLEMGAHPVLSAFTVANVEGAVCLPSLRRKMDDWTVVAGTVGQLWLSSWKGELDWRAWDECYSRTKVDLPKYPFIRQKVPLTGLVIAQKEVHPLLGHSLPTPLESHYIFQSSLALRKAPFLGDYRVGKKLIFPEVGFLEMCLAGGHHLLHVNETQSSESPPQRSDLFIKNLTFCFPLSLKSTEGGLTELHTVIKPAAENRSFKDGPLLDCFEYSISIYSRLDPTANSVTGHWIHHTTASIFADLPIRHLGHFTMSGFDLEIARQSWTSVNLTRIYEEFSEAGLHLGSTFQLLSNLWREGNQTLFQLKDRVNAEVEPEYMMHPAALQAMIQALLISDIEDAKMWKLRVPVKIGMFAWTPSTCERNDLHLGGGYVHTWIEPETGNRSCRLINFSGNTVARMEGVEFLETRADFVEAKVASICDGTETQGRMMPKLWKEVWTRVPDELEQSLRSEVVHEGQNEVGWLIFDTDGVGGNLRQRLETLGRKVFVCQRPAEAALLEANGETIVRNEMYHALVSAKAEVEFLEGVVYLWALDSSTPLNPIGEQRLSTLPLLALMKTMIMLDDPPQMIVVTQGAAIVEDDRVVHPFTSPITAMVRSLANEVDVSSPGILCLRHLDLDPCATISSQIDHILNILMFQSKSSFLQLACRDDSVFAPKLVSANVQHNQALRLPRGCTRFKLVPSKNIQNLQLNRLELYNQIAWDEVEVAVKAVGLSFQDVEAITADTEQFAKNICGVVVKIGAKVTRWAIGDRVVGKRCPQESDKLLASHLRFQERSLARLPKSWTLWEGSTIPLFVVDDNMEELERSLVDGHLKPPPFQRFDALNIRGALEYLSQMPKVGNVVLVMPEVGLEKGELKATTPLFTPDSTYLVTGGLTGIGFEVVKWLLASGAKYIAIASRRGGSLEAEVELQKYKDPDCCIRSFKVDVGSRRELEEWITHLTNSDSGFPPIRGVFHCAGLLSNAMFPNLSWDMCEATFRPKIDGTWHLHELTKHMPLEYFVLTSSIASKCAFIGHLNYSAANAFQDAVIAHRHHLGLPGTVVNWGQWGEVGLAKDLQLPGIRPMSPAEGIRALDTFLRTATHSIIADNIDSFTYYQKMAPFLKDYLEDKCLLEDIQDTITVSHLDTNKFWEEFDSREDKKERLEMLSQLVKRTLTAILQLGPGNTDDGNDFKFDTDFQSLGADSLVLLEFRSELHKIMGSRLPLESAAELRHANTPNEMSIRLLQVLEKNAKL